MLLVFDSGQLFNTGAVDYRMTGGRPPSQLTIEVEIAGQQTEAIIDTAAPYLICSPDLAERLNLDPADALESLDILIRGTRIRGGLHRVELTLLASEGASLSVEATAFVPDAAHNFGANYPSGSLAMSAASNACDSRSTRTPRPSISAHSRDDKKMSELESD